MYDFQDILYSRDWHLQAFDTFLRKRSDPLKDDQTLMEQNAGYQHTSCHGRVKLKPLVFQRGCGTVLEDVDGNHFLDFSSGIYCTNLGHSHPKISEAVARHAKTLMNCHDYLTPVKVAFLSRLANAVGGDLRNIHLYDNGTTGVEFAMRVARAATGKHEILSCFSDHHGKTMGSAALGRLGPISGPSRPSGFYLVPRPDPYRPIWKKSDGTIDTDAYIDFYKLFIKEATTDQVAAFILEPIQGWGGTIIPPPDFLPKLAEFCRERKILLIIDEVLTGSGRIGRWLSSDHWGVRPDIAILGKGIGNGFPMSALLVKNELAAHVEKVAPSTTFGGNPLACAAGLATLEVIEEDGVFLQADRVGKRVLSGCLQLQKRHPSIGHVRGMGCLLGIEFVRDQQTKEPFLEAGGEIYKECLSRKLIPGVPVIHLLRLAPQLICTDEMVDIALEILDESISAVEKRFGFTAS